MGKINTFCIITLNNHDGCVRLIETIKKYTPSFYYIYVLYNGTDDTFYDRIKDDVDLFVRPQKNLGFGKSHNQLIKLATTPFVTICNDDVEILYPEWWDEIMKKFVEDKKLGGFNPHSPCNKACDGNRYIQYPYKEVYTADDIVKMKEVFKNERSYVGCCTYFTICRKQMFDEIGLFDESFGLGSGEDYDLCIRASRKGWTIAGGSEVMVWHWWGKTKDNMPEGNANTNYDLIAGGNQNLERKWGPHIDKDPKGWSVSGQGGPEEPYDKDTAGYKEEEKWWQELDF